MWKSGSYFLLVEGCFISVLFQCDSQFVSIFGSSLWSWKQRWQLTIMSAIMIIINIWFHSTKYKSNYIKWIVIKKRLTTNSLQCLCNLCYCHIRENVPLDSLVIDVNLLGIISLWHKSGETTFTPRTSSSMTPFFTTKRRG